MGFPHSGVYGEYMLGSPIYLDTWCQILMVVNFGVVISALDFGPRKTTLLSFAYDPNIATSELTTGILLS